MKPALLKQLVRGHQRELWRYLRFLGAEPNEAESLVRETFLEASKRPPDVSKNPRAVAGFLRSVARHKLVTALARVGRKPAVPDLDQADAEWFLFAGASGGEERIERLKAGGDPLQESAEGSIDRIRLLELFQQEANGQVQPPDVWRRLKRRVARPEEIGGYRIVEEIAAGAMGVVYRAHDPNMNREVAIKLIRSEKEDERHRKRFRAEARALAKLNHPNVVRVHSAGDYEGSHYMVMAFVRGESLQERVDRCRLPERTLAALMVKLAEALQHCHDNAVLHRDLKPLNILIDHTGEPLLTDFGLAADLEANSGSSVSFIGTPGFWPPEQARGKTDQIGTGSDIYGLGATIYACLTGRPPYGKGASLQDTLELMEKPLEPPSASCTVDPSLEAVCLRCLATEPADRYPTAKALAEDLQRFLDGRPVESSASSPSAPAAKAKRGSPRWARWVLATTVLLLICGGALLLSAQQRDRIERGEQQELARLRAATLAAERDIAAELEAGQAALRTGDLKRTLAACQAGDAHYTAWKQLFSGLAFETNRLPAAEIQADHQEPLRRQQVELTVLRAMALLAERRLAPLAAAAVEPLLKPLAGDSNWCARLALAQGALLERQGRVTEAIDRYARSHQISGRLFEGYLAEARALVRVDRLDDALLTLNGTLQELDDPADARERDLRRDLLLTRCEAHRRRGLLTKAIADAGLAGALDRGWRPLALLGRAYAAAGREPEALDALDRAIAAAPERSGPHRAQAAALADLGRLEEAHTAASRAVQADPLDVESVALRAELAVELGRPEASVDAQSAARQASHDARLRARAAVAQARILFYSDDLNANLGSCLDQLKTALSLDPTFARGRTDFARVALDPLFQGQHTESVLLRLRALPRWRREAPEQRWLQGCALLQKYGHQAERPQTAFEQVVSLDSSHDGAQAALALTLQSLAKRASDPDSRRNQNRSADSAWLRALRASRDPRRPAGRSYALGLQAERRAARDGAPQLLTSARQAYRRVALLRPHHTGALLGLARLAATPRQRHAWRKRARVFDRATAPLEALALTADPTVQGLRGRELIEQALKHRGPTEALKVAELRFSALQTAPQDLAGTIDRVRAGFDALCQRRPDRVVPLIEAELALMRQLGRVRAAQPLTEPRSRVLMAELEAAQKRWGVRQASSRRLAQSARARLPLQGGAGALPPAREAVAEDPSSSLAWSILGRARAASGDLWGALTAHLLAGDGDLTAILDALAAAGASTGTAPTLTCSVRSLSPDEQTILTHAPLVARAFTAHTIKPVEGRVAFTELEQLAGANPRDLRASLLLGALAFGVRRNDYATRELLFVSIIANVSRTWYLAALATARRPSDLHASRAVTYLREAIRGDRTLLARAQADPALRRLRATPVWGLLGS